jgi:hypothetical protein
MGKLFLIIDDSKSCFAIFSAYVSTYMKTHKYNMHVIRLPIEICGLRKWDVSGKKCKVKKLNTVYYKYTSFFKGYGYDIRTA